MKTEQLTYCTRGYVLKTNCDKYLTDSGNDWGPQYIATSLQYATIYEEREITEWELKRIKNLWGSPLTPIKVNVIKIITMEE